MKNKMNPERPANESVSKVTEAASQAEAAPKPMEELGEEELNRVSGAGDLFSDVPRVPNQPIGDGLRNNV